MPKGKQLVIILLLTLIVASAGIPGVSAMAPDTRVRIEPADLAVGLGETFVIQVVIEEADNLGAFQLNLVYDPSILQVTEASLGTFLGSTGNATVPIGPEVNNAEGRVRLGAVSFGSAPGPSGTGVLATITCIAQGEGSSDLELQDVQILDTAASVQWATVEEGRVVVGSTEAPTHTATATPAPAATATSMPATTTTPAAGVTATPAPAATATSTPTHTPQAVGTPPPTATPLPSPTPITTNPATETPTEPPPPSPSPMPSVSIAPTEAKPTEEVAPTPAAPTVEATQAPATATTTPTSPPSPPPPPSPSATSAPPPTPRPSPTPLPTISAPAATSPSGSAVLGVMLAALAVAIVAVFILSRRPGG